jgi:hypothetical protein
VTPLFSVPETEATKLCCSPGFRLTVFGLTMTSMDGLGNSFPNPPPPQSTNTAAVVLHQKITGKALNRNFIAAPNLRMRQE